MTNENKHTGLPILQKINEAAKDCYYAMDWTKEYPIGSVWNFKGNIWGDGKAIIIGHNVGSKGTKSLWVVKVGKDGRAIADNIYEDQKFVFRKRLNEPASVDKLLGWAK